ncbi:MAG: hypothetical protein QOJ40_2397 [Verrucomicrobiota bacterium]
MKTTSPVFVLSVLLAAASGAFAEEKAKDAKHTAKAKDAHQTQVTSAGQYVTGSYIKQKLNRDGQITDGPSPLVVFDQQTIERSGASDLKQLLVRRGAGR